MNQSSTFKATAIEPLAVSPNDAAVMLGICPASVYKYMAAGELPSTKLGARRLVLISGIRALLDRAA